jgi:hypothetical protein
MSTASDRRTIIAAALCLSALGSACRNAPAESALIAQHTPPSSHATSAVSDAAPTADTHTQAPSPSPSRPDADLEIVGPITTPPGPTELDVTRSLRELIGWARPCIATLDDGTMISVRAVFDHGAAQRPTVTLEPPDAGAKDCVATATTALRFATTIASVEGSVRFRVVRRPSGARLDPSRLCDADADCRFVRGTCAAPAPVHYAHAAVVARNYAQSPARRSCQDSAATPAELRCIDHQCVGAALPHPEWRTCTRSADCAVLIDRDRHFSAVARAQSRAAIAAAPGARAVTAADSPPSVRCEYHFCVLGWSEQP